MKRPDKFLLHVGLNKTGTSSLQTMLAANRSVLENSGWVYPDFECTYHAHHKLAYALSPQKNLGLKGNWEERLAKLTADDSKRYLFSSELFFRVADPEVVARHFPPDQTRIVVYLRNHLGYMASWYAQAVQSTNITTQFVDYARLHSRPMSYFLSVWDRVYGPDRVTVRVFDRNRLMGGDVRHDFVSLVDGIDPDSIAYPSEENNASISGNLLFFKRLLNNYMTGAEAEAIPLPDEFGAFAATRESFRGRFQISSGEARDVNRLFRKDRTVLAVRGIDLGPETEAVKGHSVPNLDTLDDDVRLIKEIAERTNKKFLVYARRWQDWNGL